jgi:hypothetical protein
VTDLVTVLTTVIRMIKVRKITFAPFFLTKPGAEIVANVEYRRIVFWPDDRIDEPISSGTILTPAKKAGEWVILGVVAIVTFIWWHTGKGRQRRRRR